MVKKTKRNNRSRKLRGGFSWPWSKKVDEYGNPIVEQEQDTGFFSYFTDTGSNPTTSTSETPATTTSYLGLENIKMPEMPEFSNPFSSTDNSTVAPTSYTVAPTSYTVAPKDNSTVAPKDNSTVASPMNSFGGKRRSMRMRKGGYRGLGLTYYATPVNGIKVAAPTYMEYYTGGKRGKKTRKQMRKKCRKNCRKSHRHIR